MNVTTATKFAKAAALSSLLVAAGASQSRAGEGDMLALLLGGGLGALAGSQFGKGSGRIGATAGGAVLGALLGSAFVGGGLYYTIPTYRAKRRHRHDRRHHRSRHAAYRSYDAPSYDSYYAPTYAPTYATTYAPAYAPSPAPIQQTVAYDQYPNDYCREYESVVTINGMPQRSHGIACYRPDGSWRIVQ